MGGGLEKSSKTLEKKNSMVPRNKYKESLVQFSKRLSELKLLFPDVQFFFLCTCDLCNILYMLKAAAQQDAWAQRTVLRGAAGKIASMQ